MIPPVPAPRPRPGPGCPRRGEAAHHPHFAILFITNATTARGALGSTISSGLFREGTAQQWDLEEEAAAGQCGWVFQKAAPGTSLDFAALEGLPPFPHS